MRLNGRQGRKFPVFFQTSESLSKKRGRFQPAILQGKSLIKTGISAKKEF
jgi:hypothetical protein